MKLATLPDTFRKRFQEKNQQVLRRFSNDVKQTIDYIYAVVE